jgi:hypothetical protein
VFVEYISHGLVSNHALGFFLIMCHFYMLLRQIRNVLLSLWIRITSSEFSPLFLDLLHNPKATHEMWADDISLANRIDDDGKQQILDG